MAGFNTINQLYLPLKDMFRSNQNLLKYIAYNEDNPLDQPDIEDIESLFDNKIYFRPKALNTVSGMITNVIVTFQVNPTAKEKALVYSDFSVKFTLIAHNEILLLSDEEKCMRLVNIADEINNYLNGATGKIVGSFLCKGLYPLVTNNDEFSGYTLVYDLSGFNKGYKNNNVLV